MRSTADHRRRAVWAFLSSLPLFLVAAAAKQFHGLEAYLAVDPCARASTAVSTHEARAHPPCGVVLQLFNRGSSTLLRTAFTAAATTPMAVV